MRRESFQNDREKEEQNKVERKALKAELRSKIYEHRNETKEIKTH